MPLFSFQLTSFLTSHVLTITLPLSNHYVTSWVVKRGSCRYWEIIGYKKLNATKYWIFINFCFYSILSNPATIQKLLLSIISSYIYLTRKSRRRNIYLRIPDDAFCLVFALSFSPLVQDNICIEHICNWSEIGTRVGPGCPYGMLAVKSRKNTKKSAFF